MEQFADLGEVRGRSALRLLTNFHRDSVAASFGEMAEQGELVPECAGEGGAPTQWLASVHLGEQQHDPLDLSDGLDQHRSRKHVGVGAFTVEVDAERVCAAGVGHGRFRGEDADGATSGDRAEGERGLFRPRGYAVRDGSREITTISVLGRKLCVSLCGEQDGWFGPKTFCAANVAQDPILHAVTKVTTRGRSDGFPLTGCRAMYCRSASEVIQI